MAFRFLGKVLPLCCLVVSTHSIKTFAEKKHAVKVTETLPSRDAQAQCRQGRAESNLAWQFPEIKAQKASDCYAYAVVAAFEAGLTRKTLTRYSLNEEFAVCAHFRSTPYPGLAKPLTQARKNLNPVSGWMVRDFADFMKNNPDYFRWKEEISNEAYKSVTKEALRANLESVKNALQNRKAGSLKSLSRSRLTPAQISACYEAQNCTVPQEIDADATKALASLSVKDLLVDFDPLGRRHMKAYAQSYPAMKRRDEWAMTLFNSMQNIPSWVWFEKNCQDLVTKLAELQALLHSQDAKRASPVFDDPSIRRCSEGRSAEELDQLKAATKNAASLFPARAEREKIARDLKACDQESHGLQEKMIAKVCAGVPAVLGVDDDPKSPFDFHAYIVNGITKVDEYGQRYWMVRDSGTGADLRIRVSESCRIKVAFTVE
jgi:hypothetical protein